MLKGDAESLVDQQSPNFLTPVTSFVKDSFSTEWGVEVGGMVWGRFKHITLIVHFISILLHCDI